MTAYFSLFFIIALAAVAGELRRNVRPIWIMIFCAFVIILAIGLRREVGGDWYVYQRIFNHIKTMDVWHALRRTDPAYGLVNWLVIRAGLEIWAVNTVCAAIFTTGLISLSWLQPKPLLAVVAAIPYLCIVVAMGYTRQSAAIGLIMFAISQYLRGKRIQMFLSLILAAAFHKSAVIAIPIIAISASKSRAMTGISLFLLALTTYYVFLASSTERLFDLYLRRGYSSGGAGVRVAMTVIPAFLLVWFRDRLQFDREQGRLWLVFALATFAAQVALIVSPSSTAVDRIALYLIPLQVVVLSRMPMAFGSGAYHSNVATCALIAYSLSIQVVWLNFGTFSWAWLPYQSYLWEQPVHKPLRR